METLVLITQYTFLITTLGMAAGSVYFWLERDSLAEEYRSVATVAGIYTAIAAAMYWRMHGVVGLDGDIETLLQLPTHVRYIDWIITTPLILATVGLLLKIQERSASILAIVILADILMIVFGYFGELYANAGRSFEAWTLFGMGCLAYVMLLYIFLQFFGEAAKEKVLPVQRAFRFMALFIALGWSIYPLGFVIGLASDAEVAKVLRELSYNVADLVNKVGLGIVVMTAALSLTKDARIKEAVRTL
jgi:bacteriorhodopsin